MSGIQVSSSGYQHLPLVSYAGLLWFTMLFYGSKMSQPWSNGEPLTIQRMTAYQPILGRCDRAEFGCTSRKLPHCNVEMTQSSTRQIMETRVGQMNEQVIVTLPMTDLNMHTTIKCTQDMTASYRNHDWQWLILVDHGLKVRVNRQAQSNVPTSQRFPLLCCPCSAGGSAKHRTSRGGRKGPDPTSATTMTASWMLPALVVIIRSIRNSNAYILIDLSVIHV